MKLTIIAAALALGAASLPAQEETLLLRTPTVHDDRIVFTYAGDLYTVSTAGGTARRLTSDIGYEVFPRFSPDGSRIAFTAQYDGNTEVYLMDADGGVPRRLTTTATLDRDFIWDRMGPNNLVMAWRNDSTVVYRSRQREANDFKGQLFAVSSRGGLSEQLPLPRGGFCSFSADGMKMAYNRVFREFRTWKRYRGGQADDVWIHDFATRDTRRITDDLAQDIIPMWSGQKIYFLSDRDSLGRMNLYVHDLATQSTRQLTSFADYDVKFPSIGDRAIVFEQGGRIHLMDLATEEVRPVPIVVREDFDIGRGGLRHVDKEVTNYEIAPDGSRALFGARGDVFTVPAEHGPTRNITATPGVHERNSKWSPDGRWIAYISDASGGDELYIRPQDGSGPARQLTRNADTYKYQPLWSPDSKKLLWSDKKLRLQYVDVETQTVTLVDQATAWEITSYAWSPDSRWIAFARPEEETMTTVNLHSLAGGTTVAVTDGWFSSDEPAFSADGKYLFFVSDRSFSPTYGETEWNHVYLDMARIYLVTLAAATPSPFAPRSDEVTIAPSGGEKEKEKEKEKKPEEKKGVTVTVDADGIGDRIAALPVTPARYRNLQSVGSKLYYVRNGTKDERPVLLLYDLEKRKETELGSFGGFEISADGKKMILGAGGTYAIIDLPSSKIDIKDHLSLADMRVRLDRHAEWNQMFAESWRQMRDFLYAPNMHGVDWELVRTRYATLLPYVNHRSDLSYIIGEMIGELNLGHCYVGEGDYPKPERITTGLLGAQLTRDAASGYVRVSRILRGQNWDKSLRSPLTDIGANVREGDYILAIDGASTRELADPYTALIGTAGKQVTLQVNGRPTVEGARTTVVVPTDDERQLYYLAWVQGNIETVSKATGGRVGYIHIPDMGVPGLNEFAKYFYPQVRKEALIVDVRGNGGGNVSPQIIERLRREVAMIDIARNATPSPDPATAIPGPKVMLIDEFSASDGDIVGYRFRKYGMGPLIGKRTWGGVVGIRGTLPLLDGGYLMRPEFASYDTQGKEWIMEGIGVSPDIEVDNDPAREFAGEDQQLNRAIEEVMERLEREPVSIPGPPPYPVKNR